MGNGYNFDLQSAQRIVRVVRDAERTAGAGGPQAPRGGPTTGGWFFAKVIGQSASKRGWYSWELVDWLDGAWVERSPRVFCSSCTAAEQNGSTSVAPGTVVRIMWIGQTTAASLTDSSPSISISGSGSGSDDTDLAATASPWPAYLFEIFRIPSPTQRYQVFTPLDDTLEPIWTDARVIETENGSGDTIYMTSDASSSGGPVTGSGV